ncbi:molybdopterin dinucleotide binding domain-containing protein [Streptomyces sp. NPDC051133]|uniref:molybdopterin dinucleotide binding domain-containing protein n=1 Tax=Streptomyces sp. NPDC051133 TaxID=3155521 RepID=UPI00342374F7
MTVGWSGCGAGPKTGVNHGRLGPKGAIRLAGGAERPSHRTAGPRSRTPGRAPRPAAVARSTTPPRRRGSSCPSPTLAEGDIVRVPSRRGSIEAPARISHPREGVVFAPWHCGAGTAANELTLTGWDPVSTQPELKVAAVSVERVGPGHGPAPAPATTASAPVRPLGSTGQE